MTEQKAIGIGSPPRFVQPVTTIEGTNIFISRLTRDDCLAIFQDHKEVIEQVLAGIDPASAMYPNMASKMWLKKLYNPFSNYTTVYRMNQWIEDNVYQFLADSGWAAIFDRIYGDTAEYVILNTLTFSTDIIPIMSRGRVYMAAVGSYSPEAELLSIYPGSLPLIAKNHLAGRALYIMENKCRDLESWTLENKDEKWMEELSVQARLYLVEGIPSIERRWFVSQNKLYFLPGDSYMSLLNQRRYINKLLPNTFIDVYDEPLNIIPTSSLPRIPEIDEKAFPYDKLKRILEILQKVTNERSSAVTLEMWMTILSLIGWHPDFDTVKDIKEFNQLVLQLYKENLYRLSPLRPPSIHNVFSTKPAELYKYQMEYRPRHTTTQLVHIRDSLPRNDVPILCAAREQLVSKRKDVRSMIVADIEAHNILSTIYKPIIKRGIAGEPIEGSEGAVIINNFTFRISELDQVFYGTALAAATFTSSLTKSAGLIEDTNIIKEVKESGIHIPSLSREDMMLIRRLLLGECMIGVFATRLSQSGYRSLSGSSTLLAAYDHMPSRQIMDRSFVFGMRFIDQLKVFGTKALSQSNKRTVLITYIEGTSLFPPEMFSKYQNTEKEPVSGPLGLLSSIAQ